MSRLILASQSPRRKKLLEKAEVPFIVRTISTSETYPAGTPPQEAPQYISHQKARMLWKDLPVMEQLQTVVLAADTVVILDNELIGKPKDETQAYETLKKLSGKEHTVVTGVTILADNQLEQFSIATKVFFRSLTKDQIKYYVDRYQPFDKAGAYAIQEWIGMIGIEKIEGDFYNVMGLPIGEVVKRLRADFSDIFE